MSEDAAELKKAGTMEVTAKEGLDYLKSTADSFLVRHVEEVCGEAKRVPSPPTKPTVIREGTMIVTAKEGAEFLKSFEEEAAAAGPAMPNVTRDNTMAATAKEGAEYLKRLGEKELKTEMAKAGEGDTQEEALVEEKKNKRTPTKRVSTMARTAKEGSAFLEEDVELEGRRRTRSATRGVPTTPPPPKKEKKVTTPRSGGRGKRGRPSKKVEEPETEKNEDDIEKSDEQVEAPQEEQESASEVVGEETKPEENADSEQLDQERAAPDVTQEEDPAVEETATKTPEHGEEAMD